MDCLPELKKSGHCRKVAVNGVSTEKPNVEKRANCN